MQRTYSEPHWDAERGAVMAYERVTLYGLPLVAAPPRRLRAASSRTMARELFIRHALVEGDWQTRHHFFRDNAGAARRARAELEERARRRDLLVGDDEIFAFYDARIPADVVSARHFDAWWKKQRHTTPDLLTLTRDDLLRTTTPTTSSPDAWQAGDLALPVTYRFEPGADDDGVTVHVPVDVLARLGGDEFAWQVPALREELVTALIRSLPKDLRRNFVPAPDTARAVLAELDPRQEPLLDGVQRELHRRTGVLVPIDAFDLDKLPPHLRVTFAVEDATAPVVARGKDLGALQDAARRAGPAPPSRPRSPASSNATGLRDWPDDLDELPRVRRAQQRRAHRARLPGARRRTATPVDVRVFATAAEQAAAMRPGTRRLLRLAVAVAGQGRRARAGHADPAGARRQPGRLAGRAARRLRRRRGRRAGARDRSWTPRRVRRAARARGGRALVPTTLDVVAARREGARRGARRAARAARRRRRAAQADADRRHPRAVRPAAARRLRHRRRARRGWPTSPAT